MEPVIRLGRRFFIWVLATLAALESFAQMALAIVHQARADFLVWAATACLVFGAALLVERVKQQAGE